MNKNKKGITICSIFTILLSILLAKSFFNLESYDKPMSIYQVYLDGEKLGSIDSKDELYTLINKEQSEIKNEYNVDQVYPPKGFQIVKYNTYNNTSSSVDKIYNLIKDEKEFTVKGYTITIKSEEENVEPVYIYVLDKNVFEQAMQEYVKTFIGAERYKQYKENSQPEIVDSGYPIENMYFK